MKVFVQKPPRLYNPSFAVRRSVENLKNALTLQSVEVTQLIKDEVDIAHFVVWYNTRKIFDYIERKIPVVLSLFNYEDDPKLRLCEVVDKKIRIKEKYLKILKVASLLIVPDSWYVELIKDAGINTPTIKISSGNVFKKKGVLDDVEKSLFYRYFSERDDVSFVVSKIDPKNQDHFKKVYEIANLLTDVKFYVYLRFSSSFGVCGKLNKIKKVAPKNVKITLLEDNDIFISSLYNACAYLNVDLLNTSTINMLETLTYGQLIVAYNKDLEDVKFLSSENILVHNKSIDVANTIMSILKKQQSHNVTVQQKIIKSNQLDVVGKELVKCYEKLIKTKKET